MENGEPRPAFIVVKMTIAGFVPSGRLYYCSQCEHDLSDWVMTQSPDGASACPRCKVPIAGQQISQAQRETRNGCLLSLVGFALLLLIPAAIVAVLWLMYAPRP